MRISDWSSDVCSSDLLVIPADDGNAVGVVEELHRAADLAELAGGIVVDAAAPLLAHHLALRQHHVVGEPEVGHAVGLVLDRKSVVSGKSVSVRVDLGGRRILKKKKHSNPIIHYRRYK